MNLLNVYNVFPERTLKKQSHAKWYEGAFKFNNKKDKC